MSLIDFGACREYRKDFVDDYLRLVWAAANRDDPEIMRVRPGDPCCFLLLLAYVVTVTWTCNTQRPSGC